jgi:hypothetical protein
MNKATPAKPNSRTKTGAHRPFESDKRRLSDKDTCYVRPHGSLSSIVHYSFFIIHPIAKPNSHYISRLLHQY